MTLTPAELVEAAFVLQIVDVTHRAAGGSRVLALSGTFSTLTAAFDILIASTDITGVTHRAAGGARLLALSAAADFDRFADIARRAAGGTCLLALGDAFALAAHFDIKTGSAGIAGLDFVSTTEPRASSHSRPRRVHSSVQLPSSVQTR
jgi:hypothetical protein